MPRSHIAIWDGWGNLMHDRPNDRPNGSDRLWLPGDAATRRQLLANAAKFGLVAPLCMSALLAACGDDDGGGRPRPRAPGEEARAAPRARPSASAGRSAASRSSARTSSCWHEEAEKAGVKILEPQAESEAPAQVEELNAWIERPVDALLIGPVDDDSVAPAVSRANAGGHPGHHLPLPARGHRRRHVLRRRGRRLRGRARRPRSGSTRSSTARPRWRCSRSWSRRPRASASTRRRRRSRRRRPAT